MLVALGVAALIALLGAWSTQEASRGVEFLEVRGDVETPLRVSPEDLMAMPRATVRTTRDGKDTLYEGVYLHEILRRAGVPLGDALRGTALASYLLAEAGDGYQVVFALPELDPLFVDGGVLVADRANGEPLPDAEGSYRLVAARDKRGGRWVRMLERFTVVRLRK